MINSDNPTGHARRRFLMGAAGLAAAPLVAGIAAGCSSGEPNQDSGGDTGDAGNLVTVATTVTGRRKLGSLELSSLGLGCQTMPGKLYGPVTSRADMVTLIRTAVDQGVTFFDTAEAYGPLESERIVGEALQPVRDQSSSPRSSASTSTRKPANAEADRTAAPITSGRPSMRCCSGCAPTGSTFSTNTASIPPCPSKT
jgi:hypothetical protein